MYLASFDYILLRFNLNLFKLYHLFKFQDETSLLRQRDALWGQYEESGCYYLVSKW